MMFAKYPMHTDSEAERGGRGEPTRSQIGYMHDYTFFLFIEWTQNLKSTLHSRQLATPRRGAVALCVTLVARVYSS